MKHSLQLLFKKTMLFCFSVLITALAFAQDSTVTSTTTSTSTTEQKIWYMQPWAWIVGGVILLLIILLAAKGGGGNKGDTVTVRRTVTTDTDVV